MMYDKVSGLGKPFSFFQILLPQRILITPLCDCDLLWLSNVFYIVNFSHHLKSFTLYDCLSFFFFFLEIWLSPPTHIWEQIFHLCPGFLNVLPAWKHCCTVDMGRIVLLTGLFFFFFFPCSVQIIPPLIDLNQNRSKLKLYIGHLTALCHERDPHILQDLAPPSAYHHSQRDAWEEELQKMSLEEVGGGGGSRCLHWWLASRNVFHDFF